MSGSSIGTLFRVTTWGESHGPAIGAVIDGCPPLLKLKEADIQKELDRRKAPQNSRIATGRKEKDEIQIMSGVFEGKTTGTPISLIIFNRDVQSRDYQHIKNLYRPGHADFSYDLKYGIRDYRGGGRSSGRETAARVAAGAIAKKLLKEKNKTEIFGHTVQIGEIRAGQFDKNFIEKNPLRCADKSKAEKMLKYAEKIRGQGNSIGGIIEIIVKNPPKGLGEPVFSKLNAELAKGMMSIGAVKGVEIGAGFNVANLKGSEDNDQMEARNKEVHFLSNHSGGILGGISTGEDIIIRLAIKAVPSIPLAQKSIDIKKHNHEIKTMGRHDSCLMPRIIPVAESMAAMILADMYLIQKAIG